MSASSHRSLFFSFSVYGVLASLKCLASKFDVMVQHSSQGQVTRRDKLHTVQLLVYLLLAPGWER